MFGFKTKKRPAVITAAPSIAPVSAPRDTTWVSRMEMEYEAEMHPLSKCDQAELDAIKEVWRTGHVIREVVR